MKNLLLLFSFTLSLLTWAQTPKTISYQGVARNSTGQPIPNQSIKIKLSLLETANSTNSLYTETHTPTTTGQGLFAVQIGAGTVLSGTYATLDWSNGPKFVKTEIDPNGGDNFTLSSTNPLNAVPFALFAASGTPGPRGLKGDTGATGPQGPIGPQGTFPSGNAVGDMQFWNGTEWTMIPKGQPGTTLKNCDGQITWNPCKPSLSTTDATAITGTSFASGGNISNDGDSPISVRGICWSTSPNPTIANSKTMDGNGTGSFSRTLTGLGLGSTLYVRAYATNSIGTAYGNQITVTTLSTTLPTVTTTALSLITGATATSGGNVTNEGGATVTARGVVWSTVPNPTIALTTKTVDGTGTGTFISNLAGLTINTIYYLRAYATNSAGTAYGTELTFTSPFFLNGSGITDLDGNNYPTVILGTQEWMAKNLKVSKYRNGDPIATGLDNSAWNTTTLGAYSFYNGDSSNDTTFGKLYNWYTVVDPKGLCPLGFHSPSDAEWKTLEIFLGMPSIEADQSGGRGLTQNIGGKLKSISPLWTNSNAGATNSSGFSGLPGGKRENTGSYLDGNFFAYFWTTNIDGTTYSYYRTLNFDYGTIGRYSYFQQMGLSVRCVKD